MARSTLFWLFTGKDELADDKADLKAAQAEAVATAAALKKGQKELAAAQAVVSTREEQMAAQQAALQAGQTGFCQGFWVLSWRVCTTAE